jgi:hypothetical protein
MGRGGKHVNTAWPVVSGGKRPQSRNPVGRCYGGKHTGSGIQHVGTWLLGIPPTTSVIFGVHLASLSLSIHFCKIRAILFS